MIGWRWSEELTGDDLNAVRGLLSVAADHDAEAGFATAAPEAPARGRVRHLLVTMPPPGSRESAELDALPDVPVVAYLRLDVEGDTGSAQLVVHPAFRSLGVATLLVERLDEAGAWQVVPGVRRLRAWAHGAHPAADRMGRRFGAELEHAVFKTVRVLGGNRPFRAEAHHERTEAAGDQVPELVPGHHLTLNPADRVVLERARTVLTLDDAPGRVFLGAAVDEPARLPAAMQVDAPRAGRTSLRMLVAQGLLALQDQGARLVHCHVDALDDVMVAVSRELGLAHDQSDFLYERVLPV